MTETTSARSGARIDTFHNSPAPVHYGAGKQPGEPGRLAAALPANAKRVVPSGTTPPASLRTFCVLLGVFRVSEVNFS